MYCSECGVRASGKFCHSCGSALHVCADSSTTDERVPEAEKLPEIPWELDHRYERIIRLELVRSAISRYAAAARGGLTGEDFLELCDKVLASPIPLAKLVAVAQPLYASWGIRTGKEKSELIRMPVGQAIASTLISLASHHLPFQNAQQLESGCQLNAELPSSICALKGSLSIVLHRRDHQTLVQARTEIPGQLFDWGKSERCLEQLLRDLRTGSVLTDTAAGRTAA